MPAPLAPAIVAAIARAAVSNAAKKRLMQAAAKKVTQKEIRELIKTEMKTGAPKLGRASRRPDVANPPKRVVSSQGQTGSVKPPKVDPAKELYNLYKKKPDTKTVTKSMQKDRVTPADVVARRIAQKNERIKAGTRPSRVSKPPKREGLTEELKARQRALAIASRTRSDKEQPIDVRNLPPNPERAPKSELAAFGQLSKAEQKNYTRIEARIAEALKRAKIKTGPDAPVVPRRTIEEAIKIARQQRSGNTPAKAARTKRTETAKSKLTKAQLNEIKKIAARAKRNSK